MKSIRTAGLLAFVLALAAPAGATEAVPPRHVVVIVFDGMRPDFISEATTPNLWRLSREGAFFAHHHPVYCSATEVNGTAMATGDYPARSFIISNIEFRPRIDAENAIGIEVPASIRKGDEVSGGNYLGAPTVAAILHARGWATVVAGSKPVAQLHDRSRRPNEPGVSPTVYEGAALPPSLETVLDQALGDFPPIADDRDKIARDAWTTMAVIGPLWSAGVPPYTLLWLAEPDYSQHATGPGTAQSLRAIKSSDANLGLVLRALKRRGLRGSTDVFVVSDHGFSTIGKKIDVAADLSAAGFRAVRAAPGGLRPQEVIVVGQGGSALLYVGGHDRGTVRRLVDFLEVQGWTGVVFSRDRFAGTFPLAEANIDSPEAPDLVVSLRWSRDKSASGAPGLIVADNPGENIGTHASLSPYDMHNILVAAGPDIRPGVTDTLPSCNIDLAPTVLWLLGAKKEAAQMDGRVLSEALSVEAPALRSYEIKRLTAHGQMAGGDWDQYLQLSIANGVRYLDEGNGAFTPKGTAAAKSEDAGSSN